MPATRQACRSRRAAGTGDRAATSVRRAGAGRTCVSRRVVRGPRCALPARPACGIPPVQRGSEARCVRAAATRVNHLHAGRQFCMRHPAPPARELRVDDITPAARCASVPAVTTGTCTSLTASPRQWVAASGRSGFIVPVSSATVTRRTRPRDRPVVRFAFSDRTPRHATAPRRPSRPSWPSALGAPVHARALESRARRASQRCIPHGPPAGWRFSPVLAHHLGRNRRHSHVVPPASSVVPR